MNEAIRLVFLGALLASVAFAPTGYAQDGHSGFLGDYSALSEVKDAAGNSVMRYVSPKLKPGAYQAVMIDPTQYYPAPQPTEQVPASTLADIRKHMDKELRAALGAKLKLVSEPGPGVLRMRPAITAVAAQTPGLKPYQVVPIAFVFTAVKGRGKEAAINIEVEVVDSMSGERLGAAVRTGVGAKLVNSDAQLTLTDVMPLLNAWIDTGASFVASQMK